MLSKVSPWLCHEAFMNEVLDRLGAALLKDTKPILEDHEIGVQSAKLAMEFLHLRLAMVLVQTVVAARCSIIVAYTI